MNKNNVSFSELIKFLFKPKVNVIASNFIQKITENEDFEITFKNIDKKLFWPSKFSISRINQVVAESFDTDDWHYYQKKHTEINAGEIILDIGTAEGLLPISVVDKCQHIYMIEPSSLFCNCLHKTFSKYQEKTTNL